MDASKYFTEAGHELTNIYNMNQFLTRWFRQKIIGEFTKVEWKKLVRNNLGIPSWRWKMIWKIKAFKKAAFFGWLAARDACQTQVTK